MHNKFKVSINNLKNIPFDKYKKDFTFIVNGNKYETSRFIADILSPIIRNYHYSDESIDEFTINTSMPVQNDYFNEFLNLATYDEFELDFNKEKLFIEYFYLLGNIDEYIKLQQKFFKELTIENIVDHLRTIEEINVKGLTPTSETINDMFNFAASNFEMIDKEQMKILPVSIIEKILSNNSLKIKNEDSLLLFVLSLYELDNSNSFLFDYVIFPNVTGETLSNFIDNFEIDNINGNTWKSICCRLLHKKSQNGNKNSRYIEDTMNQIEFSNDNNIKEFNHQRGNEFQGILRYLNNKTNGNIMKNSTINITSNSINENYPLSNIVNYEGSKYDYYRTDKQRRAIICFDFKDKLVNLTEYSIKTGTSCSGASHLKNWIIEVSNDGDNWIEIDEHVNDPSLNDELKEATFVIKKPTNTFNRFIRIHQTGPSWWGRGTSTENLFEIRMIEFYGQLIEPQ